jgi:hypothetical protein
MVFMPLRTILDLSAYRWMNSKGGLPLGNGLSIQEQKVIYHLSDLNEDQVKV